MSFVEEVVSVYRTMEKVIMGHWPEKVKVVFELSLLNVKTCNSLGINEFSSTDSSNTTFTPSGISRLQSCSVHLRPGS